MACGHAGAVVTKAKAYVAFGKAHRIGKCGKCNTLYVWPLRDMIGLADPIASPTPCCAESFYLTTWGKREATVVTRTGPASVALDRAYEVPS